MTRSIRSDITAAAAESALLKQVVETVRWIGDGRKLTQTGALTLADARVLVPLLDTGDQLDPAIGDRVYKTKSSTELLDLSLIVGWAKAAGLVRVVRGRLVRAAPPRRRGRPARALRASVGGRDSAVHPRRRDRPAARHRPAR
ncbi:MAG: hypothetical protein ACR2G2_03195 [Pseudonocardia sp.]